MTRIVKNHSFTLLAGLLVFGCAGRGDGGDDIGAGDASGGTGGSDASGGMSSQSGGDSEGGSDGGDTAGIDDDDIYDDWEVCKPGPPPTTSQIPRMLNVEYENSVRDLLGVTAVDGAPTSSMLSPDSAGNLDNIAWSAYMGAADRIAAEVMAGANRTNYIECDPAAAGCLEETVRTFGRKAFRRPLTDDEVASFMRLTTDVEPQGTPEEQAEAILMAILASPSFIMKTEISQERDGEAYALSPYEVASRLSFTLWGTVPDDELNAAADAGQLSTPDQILVQAERMIGNRERVAPLVSNFHRFYLGVRSDSHWANQPHPDFPGWSDEVLDTMMVELDLIFDEIAFGDSSFADLFLTNVAYVNATTAPLYGLDPAEFGTELERVELDPEERPGILTRTAFLASFSHSSSTAPILRGAAFTRDFLALKLGDPVPGVEDMPPPEGDFSTNRELTEAMTSADNCAGCHKPLINPPGFVLEHYDAVGLWQDVDPAGGEINGTADVTFGPGDVVSISSPRQLMEEIAKRETTRANYARKLVSFATGRNPNSRDACVVDEMTMSLTNGGYTVLDLLVDLTQTEAFRLRTVSN